MQEIILPSGAKLKILNIPWKTARACLKAVMKEGRCIEIKGDGEVFNLKKELFCLALSSDLIEETVWACMLYCTYNGLKFDENTFEPIAARDDYVMACYEVAKASIHPFGKSLFAQYSHILAHLRGDLKSQPKTTL